MSIASDVKKSRRIRVTNMLSSQSYLIDVFMTKHSHSIALNGFGDFSVDIYKLQAFKQFIKRSGLITNYNFF